MQISTISFVSSNISYRVYSRNPRCISLGNHQIHREIISEIQTCISFAALILTDRTLLDHPQAARNYRHIKPAAPENAREHQSWSTAATVKNPWNQLPNLGLSGSTQNHV